MQQAERADCEDTGNAETKLRSYSGSLVDLLHDSDRTAVTIYPVDIDPHSAGARGQIVW